MKVYIDPYIDRKYGVMKNLKGITDSGKLEKMEAEYTSLCMREMAIKPVKGQFDFQHLCEVHRYIFQDIYEWAGSPRIIDIEKEESVLGGLSIQYAESDKIEQDAKKILQKMQAIPWNKLSLNDRVIQFSTCMADLWKVHPFREGNTRTIITFCCDFAESHGFGIDRNLFKENSMYVRNALVAAAAKFSDIGDYSKPEYLYRIVKDGMERWEKENPSMSKLLYKQMQEWEMER